MPDSMTSIAIAAACVGQGLSADEAEAVWQLLVDQMAPVSVGHAHEQIAQAIETVKEARP